ncbi:SLATT domain-containing protein [Cellulosilyticum sp. I15G10I2]|uniref:SLATT domain-containing protein n=1 Tax=Cellulosilyticum sp. I15G10I2 TaxID=1892843 RepID=UPI00085BFCA7|nr:SLATT domain-containing protein [Cellulosilyticum sp. I15G10I2]
MEAVEKLKMIETELDNKIRNIKPKFVKTRTKARCWRIAAILIGIITTMVLGVEDISWGKTVGFILSAVLTGVYSIESLFDYASKSVQEHDYYSRLTNLKQDIAFYKEGKAFDEYSLDAIELFFMEFTKIRTKFHNGRIETVRTSYENTKVTKT